MKAREREREGDEATHRVLKYPSSPLFGLSSLSYGLGVPAWNADVLPPSLPQAFLLHLFPVAIDQISSREIITWHHYHSQHFYLLPLVSSLHRLIKFREGRKRGKREYLLTPAPINRFWRSCLDWGTHAKLLLLVKTNCNICSSLTFISNGNECSRLLTMQKMFVTAEHK